MDQLRDLKDEAAQAMGRGQWQQAFELFSRLVQEEPHDATWAMRAGDLARRLEKMNDAVIFYQRAARAYQTQGFVVRAIAVGKMIESLDPGNDQVLRDLDAAQRSPAPPPAGPPPVPRRAPPPAPRQAGPPPIPRAAEPPKVPRPSSPPVAPPPFRPAHPSRELAPGTVEAPSLKPRRKGEPRRSDPPGPPLKGRLSGPLLNPQQDYDPSVESMEIVFDDADDGIPIQDSDILLLEGEVSDSVEVPSSEGSKLLDRIPSFPIFEVLPAGSFLSVVSRMTHLKVSPGEVIVRQGEKGTSLFAIVDGEAMVYIKGHRDRPLATLRAGDVFGEMALVLDQPRAATVEAATHLELFEMERRLLREVIEDHPQVGEMIGRLIKRRLVENVMTMAPLFKQLDVGPRQELLKLFEIREVSAGTRLVEQGTASDGLYLIVSGHIYARFREEGSDEPPKIVAVLRPGQTFGADSMLDTSNVAPTSFETPENAIVLRLPRSAFFEVISTYPPVLEYIAEVAEDQRTWLGSGKVPMV